MARIKECIKMKRAPAGLAAAVAAAAAKRTMVDDESAAG
jgi:hypothetical protein